MIPIYCDTCIGWNHQPAKCDCEWNAHFHRHRCPVCVSTVWLMGGPENDDVTHARSILRGNCHLLPKTSP